MLIITIRCDGCDVAGDDGKAGAAEKIRAGLREMGWRRIDGCDYCPSCLQRARDEAKIAKQKQRGV